MTENPHRDARIRTGDPRHPKAPECDRARPAVPMNGGISPDGTVISERSQSSVGTGCGHSGGHLDLPRVVEGEPIDYERGVAALRRMPVFIETDHIAALHQPPTPQESHGSRDRRAVESMRVAARFRRG